MNFLRVFPVILSLLLLGAHFYRAGLPAVSIACLALPLLLLLRKSWVPRLFQVLLLLGALEWLLSLYGLISMRIAFGDPWLRLAIILGAVALFTGLSGLVFRHGKLRTFYGLDSR